MPAASLLPRWNTTAASGQEAPRPRGGQYAHTRGQSAHRTPCRGAGRSTSPGGCPAPQPAAAPTPHGFAGSCSSTGSAAYAKAIARRVPTASASFPSTRPATTVPAARGNMRTALAIGASQIACGLMFRMPEESAIGSRNLVAMSAAVASSAPSPAARRHSRQAALVAPQSRCAASPAAIPDESPVAAGVALASSGVRCRPGGGFTPLAPS